MAKAGTQMDAETAQMNADNTAEKKQSSICVYLQIIRVCLRSRFLTLVSLTLALGCGHDNATPRSADVPKVVQIPDSVRIRVEVINTTTQRGLGRRAMFFLRDQGFDVVRYTSGSAPRDSTQIIDRSGHREWADLVAKALGVSRVVVDVDSARYLDVTVLLGRDWRPPAKPFYP
jgi:hypothetical protein